MPLKLGRFEDIPLRIAFEGGEVGDDKVTVKEADKGIKSAGGIHTDTRSVLRSLERRGLLVRISPTVYETTNKAQDEATLEVLDSAPR